MKRPYIWAPLLILLGFFIWRVDSVRIRDGVWMEVTYIDYDAGSNLSLAAFKRELFIEFKPRAQPYAKRPKYYGFAAGYWPYRFIAYWGRYRLLQWFPIPGLREMLGKSPSSEVSAHE